MDKSEFYYRLNNSRSAQILKTKKKNLIEIFSDREKEIKDFISSNKLDLDERADLIKLFDYYNSLTQKKKNSLELVSLNLKMLF